MIQEQKGKDKKIFILSLTKNEAFLLTEEILKNEEVFKIEYSEYKEETATLMRKIAMLKSLHDKDLSDFI